MTNMTAEEVFTPTMVGNTSNTFRVTEGTNNDDYYAAQSYLGAAYTSMFIPMGETFTANVGVRAEYNSIQLQSFTRGSYRPVNVDKPLFNILPSVNFSYNIHEKHKLRAAYSMTVNRPEFRELAPFSYYDFEERVSITGNTALQAATIQNVDIRYEFYPSKDELITLSAFYKHFNNPIEREGRQSGNGINYSFGNPNSAMVYGLELDVRKTIPYILKEKLSVVLNASYIFSQVDASNRPGQLENRTLQGQSPYLINMGLYYNGDKFKASALYNSFGDRIFAIGDKNGNQSIYETTRHVIDLNFGYNVSKKVELSFSIQDLLNQPFTWKTDTDSNSKIDGNDLLFRQYRRGQYFNLGLNVKF
jgi:TonB-dependent receptor